ncbi:hypothetical protein [Flammeovirga kamogawensis]|uniref:DUF600 family protein n=1 Tax=Flammeovirga kamogawensis TaxID=373891 RepID=A0ABX8H2D8_9BACT|nr:hypothetical protein [Flammeovirga kamogawensis]MBB6463605.1 hypothetical protein [Flammeovirga kamogawensis]QWG09829.1 hypothetical protein KM029_19305 [Flammeovirga kamogawensis]TRX65337.1 hypothetical protein EO216_22705 [Flammeovirga kamogawensis]
MNEFIETLVEYLNNNFEWDTLHLKISIQPKSINYKPKFFLDNERIPFRLKSEMKNYIMDTVQKKHIQSTKNGKNKWNFANLTLYPDGSHEIEYIWNQDHQDEVDGYNREAEEEDPNYKAPKWHWEE